MPNEERDATEHPGGVLLGDRTYSLADQQAFADFCGDRNPIHLDALYARRTISGEIVVHGVNTILWALDLLVARGFDAPARLKATFRKPIFLNERVDCRLHEARNILSIWRDKARLVDIAFQPGAVPAAGKHTLTASQEKKPAVVSEADLADAEPRPLHLRGRTAHAPALFPALCTALGDARVCDLAATSEIVGMQIPGLHSLYLSLKTSFVSADAVTPFFKVESFDRRFRIVNLEVKTTSLEAQLSALLRPPPAKIPRIAELEAGIVPGEFNQVRALIVGGSRGLGEATAKIIACGGGSVTITYNVGADEAKQLVDEISGAGGKARMARVDVLSERSVADVAKDDFNQIYYFATPKIFGKRSSGFDTALLERFRDFYVRGFSQLVEHCGAQCGKVAVFFPSTTAIDQPLPELAEYVAAKREGESACANLAKTKALEVLCPRIPRTQTDQTAAVVAVAAGDPVLIMAPFIRRMTALTVAGPA